MLAPHYFTQAGFFVAEAFLEPAACRELMSEMRASAATGATVVDGATYQVDERLRKANLVHPSRQCVMRITRRLQDLLPVLERHFGRTLSHCAGPEFLIYRAGDFFKPHQDVSANPAAPHEVRTRAISAILFLNERSSEPRAATYGGGALNFFNITPEPTWRSARATLTPEPGMLVAFPSQTFHEVRPIEHGERYSIVTWYYGDDPLEPKGS